MASKNLESVRSICAAMERGEFGSTVAWWHPDIEIVWPNPAAVGSTLLTTKGRDEAVEQFGDFLGAFEAASFATEEIRVIDHERVLVVGHYRGRGKASGLEIEKISREAGLFHLEDGRVTKVVLYLDRNDAFADLGLAPEGDTTD